MLAGRAAVGVGESTFEVSSGCVVYIPARVPHWYRTEGDESLVFLCLVPNAADEIRLAE